MPAAPCFRSTVNCQSFGIYPAGCLPLPRVALQLPMWSLPAPPSVSQCALPWRTPVCWRLRITTGPFPRIFLTFLSPETSLCTLCSLSLSSHPFLIVLISFWFGLVLVWCWRSECKALHMPGKCCQLNASPWNHFVFKYASFSDLLHVFQCPESNTCLVCLSEWWIY